MRPSDALPARLIETRVPTRPEGVVLVLHGGARKAGVPEVSPTQPSVLRMIPTARRIARADGRLAVYRVLNTFRGWETDHTPVRDVRWALREVSERLGGPLPTCLVGHSLGGAAALMAGGRDPVRSVVALAPWVYGDEAPEHGLAGRRVLFVHGDEDRIARPDRSARLARALAATADVRYVTVRGGKHAMLSRGGTFDGLAAAFAASTLLGTEPRGALGRRLTGEPRLDVA